MPVKILVVDEHPVVHGGIVLESEKIDVKVLGHVTALDQLPERMRELQPDVLVTEVRMGGHDALKILEKLREEFPDCEFVAFSSQTNPTHIARAAALGCHDYILKTSSCSVLMDSVVSAASGNPTRTDSLLLTTKARMQRKRGTEDLDIPLTNREMQVLRHVSLGLSNREIGKSLGISVETVKEHVQNILRKLDVNDRTQAAVWAVKGGLV